MKIRKRPIEITFLFFIILVANGCRTATYTLWDRQHHQPSTHPDLKLMFDAQHKNVLVSYEECVNSTHRRSTYWLFASKNTPPSYARLHSKFVETTNGDDLQVIPVFSEEKTSPPAGYWAIHADRTSSFALGYDGKKLQEFKLPEYSDWARPTVWRVVLTPFSLVGDAFLTVGEIPFHLSEHTPPGLFSGLSP